MCFTQRHGLSNHSMIWMLSWKLFIIMVICWWKFWTWNIALLVLISFLSFIRVYVPWLWSSLQLICLLTLYCYFRSEATDICVIHFCLAVCIVDSFLAMMWGAFYVMSFMIHFLFQVIEFGRRAHFDASKILPCKLEYVGLSTTEYCFTLPRIVGCTFYVLCSHP